MLVKPINQDGISPGILKQLATVQQTATQSGVASGTPMWFDLTNINSSSLMGELGSEWDDGFTGNSYRLVKAGAALTPGQLVGPQAPTTGTVTASGSTVYVIITNVTTTVNEAGNYVWFLDAVGTYSAGSTPFSQSLRQIKATSIGSNATITVSQRGSIYGNNVYDPDALPAVPTNGSALSIIRPFVVGSASATIAPIGVSLGAVTSGNYTIIQTRGLAMIAANNVGAATVVGTPGAVQSSGIFTGGAAAATGAAGIIPLVAFNSATTSLIPAYVSFKGA